MDRRGDASEGRGELGKRNADHPIGDVSDGSTSGAGRGNEINDGDDDDDDDDDGDDADDARGLSSVILYFNSLC